MFLSDASFYGILRYLVLFLVQLLQRHIARCQGSEGIFRSECPCQLLTCPWSKTSLQPIPGPSVPAPAMPQQCQYQAPHSSDDVELDPRPQGGTWWLGLPSELVRAVTLLDVGEAGLHMARP